MVPVHSLQYKAFKHIAKFDTFIRHWTFLSLELAARGLDVFTNVSLWLHNAQDHQQLFVYVSK